MTKILVIDNFDSFTYNLVQYLFEIGCEASVYRNDSAKAKDLINKSKPDAVLISPGPSVPDNAGLTLEMIDECFKQDLPLFGVCLGHQAIGQYFGGKIIRMDEPVHGKTAAISHDNKGGFQGLPSPFKATRYHSLVIDPASMPQELNISAQTSDGVIMGVRHQSKKIEGVQFHPESILTQHGKSILRNFFTTN